jgi:hypothetical protein
VSQNMEHWPSFHNGVAAGLRLSAEPGSHDIDSMWICFNKPKGGETTAQTEHASFLMALGLNGTWPSCPSWPSSPGGRRGPGDREKEDGLSAGPAAAPQPPPRRLHPPPRPPTSRWLGGGRPLHLAPLPPPHRGRATSPSCIPTSYSHHIFITLTSTSTGPAVEPIQHHQMCK